MGTSYTKRCSTRSGGTGRDPDRSTGSGFYQLDIQGFWPKRMVRSSTAITGWSWYCPTSPVGPNGSRLCWSVREEKAMVLTKLTGEAPARDGPKTEK